MGQEMNLMDGASGDKLLAGVLEHLACYLQTGGVRSAHQAGLLLEHLAAHPVASDELRERVRRLQDVLEEGLEFSAPPARARVPAAPWLTWRWLEDAA